LGSHDIFVFASIQDDWGFVLTEAMVNKLIVIVPDVHPFNEMVPNAEFRFKPGDVGSFKAVIGSILKLGSLDDRKSEQFNHAEKHFSYFNFVHKLNYIFSQRKY
jgi:hypothetical protein